MAGPDSFADSFNRVKTLLSRYRLKCFFLLSLSISLVFLCITLLVIRAFQTGSMSLFVYLASMVSGMAVSLGILWITRRDVKSFMIDLDRRYDGKELFSTAYEVYRLKTDSVFSRTLLKTAAEKLDGLSDKQIISRSLLPGYGVITILVLSWGLLQFVPQNLPEHHPDHSALKQLAVRMEEFTNRKQIRMLRENNKQETDTFSKWRDLSQKMKNQSMEKDRVEQSIAGLQDQLSQEKRQLAEKLNRQLQTSKFPRIKPLKIEKTTLQELEKLVLDHEGLFKDGLPEDIKQKLEDLSAYGNAEEFLDQMRKELDSLSDGLSGEGQHRESTEEIAQNLESERNNTDSDKPDKYSDQDGPIDSSGTPGMRRGGSSGGVSEQQERDKHNETGTITSASKGKSTGKGSDSSDITTSKKQPEILRSDKGKGEWGEIQIRSTTTIGEVKMTQKPIIRDYQRDLDTISLKEAIPRKHQQTIKNYFLQIGLKGGEENNGTIE